MSDYLERLAAARGLEVKFLGSGLTTAAAKKRFTAARRQTRAAMPGARGRQLADVAGTDARLARANKYLTARGKPSGRTMSWDDIEKMTERQMHQFYSARIGKLRQTRISESDLRDLLLSRRRRRVQVHKDFMVHEEYLGNFGGLGIARL